MTAVTSIQRITLRQGDDLPSFAAVVQTTDGVAVDLTSATGAYLNIRASDGTESEQECAIVNAATGTVTYDWTRVQTLLLEPGEYELTVRVDWPSGVYVVAPSDRNCLLVVRPEITNPPPTDNAWLTTIGVPIYSTADEQVFAVI